MNLRTWIGLALIAFFLGSSYFRIKAKRRSGITTSFGHPVLDNLFLLTSGLLLAGALGFTLWLAKVKASHIETRLIVYPLFLAGGSFLTWLCNGILRNTNRRGQPRESEPRKVEAPK